MSFNYVLSKYRKISFSQRDKGDRFERLMQAYLLTDPKYSNRFKNVWLWNDFHGKNDMGGNDTGIDLVAKTFDGDYWAIQCKCFQETLIIDKPAVDSFLATSSREFKNEDLKTVRFSHRLWISTTNRWGPNANEAIKNQNPPVTRLNLFDLQEAPVDWESLENGITGEASRTPKKTLMLHQRKALENAHSHFSEFGRGKMIMACGTGKTFTSLRIAEHETNGNGLILFLVPSISLLGQSLRAWTSDANEPIKAICICSDAEISRQKMKNEDSDTFTVVDLALPASTNTKDILHQFGAFKKNQQPGMTVVFSTYQSIDVIARAQKDIIKLGYGEFDMIICDEAHRTTGVSIAGEDESAFVKVHDNNLIQAKKRLYMTATPRLFSDDTKSKAAKADAVLASMDDEDLYGQEFYRIGFGEAVDKNLLSDYKVLILTLSDQDIPPAVQKMISDKESEINTDDASKLIGCVNALSKQILGDEGILKSSDPEPMRRAVAFCSSIAVSKKITATYNTATEAYLGSLPPDKKEHMVSIESNHIDGTMTAPHRDELLGWLKEETKDNECRILTNVRCLSEGVDVPSLDAVLFLSARNSQVDVVQSVGRVMRRSEGKKYGYIIIPVVVPSNVEADKALDDNERYKVVWTVLNALRAHDDRFNATVNQIDLNKKRPASILVGGPLYGFDSDGNPIKKNEVEPGDNKEINRQMALQFEQLQNVIFARMVIKVGDKRYWEQWAKSVAEIAQRHTERITKIVNDGTTHQKAFESFLKGLHKNINPSITQPEAIEMLSQHIITKPVFEALFEGYSFVQNNPMSQSMQKMLDLLEEQSLEKDAETLDKFYQSVKTRAAGIDNAEGKQRIIIELYDKFFKTAFPKMVEKLGIVYTPLEVVDFIIHSVNDILIKEFGRSISDDNIHILDPFTGTGTFITRLLQSGLIDEKDLIRKYKHELHANEIVLLAYYIASVNIENAFHEATLDPNDGIAKDNYIPFDGIVLTDTFQLGETDDGEKLFSEMFPQNSKRVQQQKKAPLRIIIGNPPYSVGQNSANDNAQNQTYKKLNDRISKSYAKMTDATNKNSLYDSYIKAFRWSTDRLDKNGGIICFVSNGAWLDGNSSDGFRKTLENEFTSIYVLNLRGNQRTSGEVSRKEGGKIFGSGSRTPIAITLLVKNPTAKNEKSIIYYHDIGDYLSREEKLKAIQSFKTFINPSLKLTTLQPNQHGDWLSQRNNSYKTLICIGDKKQEKNSCFFKPRYTVGIKTQRDAWCFNFSKNGLVKNMTRFIDFYDSSLATSNQTLNKGLSTHLDFDEKKIKWSRGLIREIEKGNKIAFEIKNIRVSDYRPFNKQFLYFDSRVNEEISLLPSVYPSNQHNKTICISAPGSNQDFSCLMSGNTPDLHLVGDVQAFPLYYYEENHHTQKGLFDTDNDQQYIRRDAISEFIFERAQKQYGKSVTKEDIFYYVYGFLHSKEYRETYANDLRKKLPRLPLVDEVQSFWTFSKSGRKLAELHLNYESVAPYPDLDVVGDDGSFYIVEKMRFLKKGQTDTIIYNSKITIKNIPPEAYEYVINGKSAVNWIMERYAVTTHKESGIKNDPNNWAEEVGNSRYILDLLLSIINVSVQTVHIIKSLPKVEFE